MADFTKYDDTLDVREIIARIEELEDKRPVLEWTEEDMEELKTLSDFLSQMKGYGGDEQWRGDWYPVTLIRDSYFEEYAQELAEDCGDYDPQKLRWPLTCIDWKWAARELKMDYNSVELEDVTYWYR